MDGKFSSRNLGFGQGSLLKWFPDYSDHSSFIILPNEAPCEDSCIVMIETNSYSVLCSSLKRILERPSPFLTARSIVPALISILSEELMKP